jgi:hypothetical protein
LFKRAEQDRKGGEKWERRKEGKKSQTDRKPIKERLFHKEKGKRAKTNRPTSYTVIMGLPAARRRERRTSVIVGCWREGRGEGRRENWQKQ